MAILVLSGLLSVPSAVFAEASWYGSLRPAIEIGGGEDAKLIDGNSRWGIKGSSEAGEGLTAVYRFETEMRVTDAVQWRGRLAYAGLSGGFGSLTIGQVWGAAYNATGAITDNARFYGNSHTGYRTGNALSYAVTAGSLSMQIDAVMDGDTNTDKAVDALQFGLSVDLGDIGTVAFAHVKEEDQMKTMDVVPATYGVDHDTDASTPIRMVSKIRVKVAKNYAEMADGELNATGAGAVLYNDTDGFYIGECEADDATADNACTTATVWRWTEESVPAGGGAGAVNVDYYAEAEEVTSEVPAKTVVDDMKRGSKSNHVAVQVVLGGVTMYLGQSEIKTNGMSAKDKITHYGVAGSLGDTGLNYLVQARKKKEGSMSSDPWLLSINRSLGDGATAFVEHANDDVEGKSGRTWVGLKVDF